MIKKMKIGLILIVSLLGLSGVTSVFAQDYVVDNTYVVGGGFVDPTFFNPPTVIVVPRRPVLVIPRQGSNDYLYQYDNVYGRGASAAGRMSRTVVNPPPQFYIRGF